MWSCMLIVVKIHHMPLSFAQLVIQDAIVGQVAQQVLDSYIYTIYTYVQIVLMYTSVYTYFFVVFVGLYSHQKPLSAIKEAGH